MNRNKVTLDNHIKKQLAKLAGETYPFEGCGVLLGSADGYRIREVKSLNNDAGKDSAKTFFAIDPLSLYEIETEENDYEIIGFYHTHPEHRAVPSKEDEKYMIPGMLYMIVSVSAGYCSDVRLYHKLKADGGVKEIKIEEAA